jgi:response regulator RpfG family c-di-GMP phosphodiesterase
MRHRLLSSFALPAGAADGSVALSLARGGLCPEAAGLLDQLLGWQLLDDAPVAAFLQERAQRGADALDEEQLANALVQTGLLTRYQLERARRGDVHGLLLGNYRVREELGKGGMGVVYRCEHRLLQRRVAIKVLPVDDECPASVRQRFYAEMCVLAELSHPNIVLALDAGELPPVDDNSPGLIYLVEELVEGGDLDRYIQKHGPCEVAEACDYVRQAATGLQLAHDRHLIHRDIKPSNLLLAANGQVKVVDFGLARQFCSRLTDQRVLLGSIEFMPPEQSHDPSIVGKEADVYGLGATLFYLLTGEAPYPYLANVGAALRALQTEEPRRLSSLREDVPPALDALVAQMLDRAPGRRPSSPLVVCNALVPFVAETARPTSSVFQVSAAPVAHRALIVDDEARVRRLHRSLLEEVGCACIDARDGLSALELASITPFDLVLLDLRLPDVDGYEVCRRLRQRADNPNLKIIIVSGTGDCNDLADSLPRGADDYVVKPFAPRQLLAKVSHALQLKDAQDRAGALADQLVLANRDLQKSLEARAGDVREAHNALLFAMAKMAESRDGETPGHLRRMQAYSLVLGRQAALAPPWTGLVDDRFLEQVARTVPLHDIGKIGLPDDILLKPGALSAAERKLVETHPLIGDRILESLGREHGTALEFLCLARVIVRHHHERFDGRGYPDRLAGDAIPPAARIVAVADVYDALRRERLYKPAVAHTTALRVMVERSEGQFDPTLLKALSHCHSQFERIYREITD